MMDRVQLLGSLLRLDRPVAETQSLLATFGWDSERELVTLERRHLTSLLERYARSAITERDIEDWANTIEGREDIGYEKGFEEVLREAIYELANPTLTRPLSRHLAREWTNRLSSEKVEAP